MIFLRPFFLILLFVPVFVWFFFKKTVYRNAWTKVCDPHLLPYLTINVNEKKTKLYTCLMCFVWIIGVLALSGPAFIKKDAVTVSAQSGLAVVVDMSPVTDGKAIQQVVHKLYDIADMKKDTAVGLILADQKAYIALPLTQDKDILKTMASQLKEKNIMPAIGQNIPAGIEHAEKLLTQSGFQKGQIIVFIAGIHDTEELKNIVEKSPYTIYFIGVGDMLKAQPVQLENGRFWNEGKLYGLSEIKKEFSSQRANPFVS